MTYFEEYRRQFEEPVMLADNPPLVSRTGIPVRFSDLREGSVIMAVPKGAVSPEPQCCRVIELHPEASEPGMFVTDLRRFVRWVPLAAVDRLVEK